MTRAIIAAVALALGLVAPWAARAQAGNPLPVPEESKDRTLSTPGVYQRESAFKRKYEDEKERKAKLEDELKTLRTKLEQDQATAAQKEGPAGPVPATPSSGASSAPKAPGAGSAQAGMPGLEALKLEAPVPLPGVTKKAVAKKRAVASEPAVVPGGEPMVFAVSPAALQRLATREETAVPLGSYVKAKVLTGVEANTQEAYPVLLQLDYAFVGPNHTRIDMSNCFMVAKAKANLSTERVMGETQQISCVRSNNEIVAKAAKGYLAGEDSTFGLTGRLISHQGQVLLAAVLASLAKGAGEAVAAAQTTTALANGGVGGVASATNVTGSEALYVAGRAVTDAGTLIANWYLDYAKQLVPSIAVGSGRDVWVVLLDTVKVPTLDADGEEGSDE